MNELHFCFQYIIFMYGLPNPTVLLLNIILLLDVTWFVILH